MPFRFLEVELKEGYAILRLKRPRLLNAINKEMKEELLKALEDLREDDRVRALILTGSGRAFCSGLDLRELERMGPWASRAQRRLGGTEPFNALAQFPKPTIAAINGAAVGGGLELALACDIRLAAKGALLGFPEVKRGLMPGGGGTQRLPRLIGSGRAKELIFTGELIRAEEAEAMGLVNHTYSKQELLRAAEDLAKKIAKNAPLGVMLAKAAIDRGLDADLSTGLAYEGEVTTLLHFTRDKEEGIRAFLEKREPRFGGS